MVPEAFESTHADAQAALSAALERVERLHAERRADPGLARALEHLARWQSARLGQTYRDLASDARYADAIAFFRSDPEGYGSRSAMPILRARHPRWRGSFPSVCWHRSPRRSGAQRIVAGARSPVARLPAVP
jgi:hypothetical protein